MIRARTLILLVLAALFAVVALAPAAPAKGRKDVRLRQFKTCPSLIAYGIRHAPAETQRAPVPGSAQPMPVSGGGMEDQSASGAPAPTAAPAPEAGKDFSTTNTQVAGVDEPDIVKTDGETVFAIAHNSLQAVDVRGDKPKLVGTLPITTGYGAQLLIHGKRALVTYLAVPDYSGPVIMSQEPAIAPAPGYYSQPKTVLAEVDISDPAKMRIVRTMTVDGSLVASRLTGSSARVVLTTLPRALYPPIDTTSGAPGAAAAGVRARTAKVNRRRAKAWLPSAVFVNRRAHTRKRRALTHCRATRHPKSFSGLGMLTVLTIDLSKGLEPVDSDSLMTTGETVYASQTSLYVATQRYVRGLWEGTRSVPANMTTEIHKFDISDPDDTRYRGSGQVPGFLLSQFSMDQHEGILRVASTSEPTWAPGDERPSFSQVTTLDERDGALVQRGQVAGLGAGERIYAVRFIGDVGYVVTFRQVDPLYTIGLADPDNPKVLGELKIRGYSAYLHPAGEDLLIGIGQDATDQGFTTGFQISLFDVSDAANPTRVQQYAVGQGSSSPAEFDHHAFLWWPKTELAVLPVTIYGNSCCAEPQPAPQPDGRPARSSAPQEPPFSGAIGFSVKREAIKEAGRVTHATEANQYGPQVERSIVIGDRLLTLSQVGLKFSRLDTLADLSFVPFA